MIPVIGMTTLGFNPVGHNKQLAVSLRNYLRSIRCSKVYVLAGRPTESTQRTDPFQLILPLLPSSPPLFHLNLSHRSLPYVQQRDGDSTALLC